MPRMLRMPGKDVLPPGPKRELVAELYVHYREAARPPLPQIATLTGTMPNPHKVSRETIRRLLTGTTTSQWAVVDALLRALCHLQDRDPDGRRWLEPDDNRWDENDPATCREHLRRLWNNDIDGLEPDEAPATPPAAPAQAASAVPPARQASGGWGGTASPPTDNPWATSSPPKPAVQTGGGYSDEPPF
ncbi:hypothetical protein [Streptomyces sp. NBC_00564]|uniref:hypothetical protein n=1 Tax=Streptomyces sp. NBC_00564 TaxID=2903663 RepID=UPI00352DC865|nr:hypothetical protein OG256_45765 [Streptomyces sp. NBC_00564]